MTKSRGLGALGGGFEAVNDDIAQPERPRQFLRYFLLTKSSKK
jgi:hypothetical protein